MYKIREARTEDFSMIAVIHDDPAHIHLQKEAPIDEQTFKSIIDTAHMKMYVVEKSGVIAAFLLFQIDQQEQTLSIDNFSIDHAYRKKGLDEHLYLKVERLAIRTGLKRLVANINVDDPDVYDFFERKGWKQTEQENQYDIEL